MMNWNGKNGRGLIVAIDGPSGAGKSTVTKLLADRLGYIYVDTGAMFRAVALAADRSGVSVEDDNALADLCSRIRLSFMRDNGCCRIMLNDEDVSEAIRAPAISMLTSAISARKVVREFLMQMQREMGKNGGVVLEGRDIGTVVFPEAEAKFFLTASVEERGMRRYRELQAKGIDMDLETTVAAVMQRDEQDVMRKYAPLCMAEDAVQIDSTGLSIDEVVTRMEKLVKEKFKANGISQ